LKGFLQVVASQVWLAHVVVDATHVVVVQYWGRLPQVSANTQALIENRALLLCKQYKIPLFPPWFFDYVMVLSSLYTSMSGMVKQWH
jgi:hypothetical protein